MVSKLRPSKPKGRLCIVRVGQGSGSHCSYGIKTLSILCHERLFGLFGWVCVCVEEFADSGSPKGVGQGTNLWEGMGTKNMGRGNLSNTNSRYLTFPWKSDTTAKMRKIHSGGQWSGWEYGLLSQTDWAEEALGSLPRVSERLAKVWHIASA